MPFQSLFFAAFLSVALLFSFSLRADGEFPVNLSCLKNGVGQLPFMNETVLRWKKETKNQYLDRALIQGKVERLLKTRKSHIHVEVRIGVKKGDLIEVIYNREFGALPKIVKGMQVEACGDYITSNAPAGSYPASPDGAIVHWVHMNTKPEGPKRHEDGFVRLDGVTYGQKAPREPSPVLAY